MDVSALTCEEVNRELARRRGDFRKTWNFEELPEGKFQDAADGWYYWWPDYCHDWRWAGVLFIELLHLAHCVYVHSPPLEEQTAFVGVGVSPAATHELWCFVGIDVAELPEYIARARLQMYEDGEDERA